MPMQDAKYLQVMDWVRKGIESGRFRSGDRLPSEAQLGSMFGLSRQTIRRATGELETERLVTRVQGSGTYIAAPHHTAADSDMDTGSPRSGSLPAGERKAEAASTPPEQQGGYHFPTFGSVRVPTFNIAVVSTFYESYIFPQTLKGIEHVLAKNGYAMQVSFTDNRVNRERSILQSILEKDNIDGMIVEPAKSALPNPNLGYYQAIRDSGVPILFFNASYRDFEAPCVRLDDVKIASKATQVLIDHGHKHLAGIFKGDDRQGPLRYQGFVETILRAGLKVRHEQVFWLDTPMTVNVGVIEDYLFSRIQGCTGVLCYNDEVGCQFIDLALRRGLRVPEDLSVIGIDDSYLAGIGRVPLTSFPHPKEELGRKVSEIMLRMIENPAYDGNYLFDSNLVLRDSVAPLR